MRVQLETMGLERQAADARAGVAASKVDVQPVQAPTPAGGVELRRPPTARAMQAAAAQIESYLERTSRSVNFSVDHASGETVVTVRNRSTGEVVRQIPNEEALRIAQQLERTQSALVDLLA